MKILIIRQLKVVVFRCLHPANYVPRNLKSWHSVLCNKRKGKNYSQISYFPKENNTGNMDVGEVVQIEESFKKDNLSSPGLSVKDNKNGKIFNYKPEIRIS